MAYIYQTHHHYERPLYDRKCIRERVLSRDGLNATIQVYDRCTGEEFEPYEKNLALDLIMGTIAFIVVVGITVYLVRWGIKIFKDQ